MTVLSDGTIERLALNEKLIHPFDGDLLQPGSYDLTFGDEVLRLKTGTAVTLGQDDRAAWNMQRVLSNGIIVYPHEFLLGHAAELINLPDNLIAFVEGRSSIGRSGLQIHCAGLCDPGWSGQITLELKNQTGRMITIPHGFSIAQIDFHFLDAPAVRPYARRGRYQFQQGTTVARRAANWADTRRLAKPA